MSAMIERVARACAWEHVGSEQHWQEWADMAKAAIEAMREPTAHMLSAGPPEPYMDSEVWARMIDAAIFDPRDIGVGAAEGMVSEVAKAIAKVNERSHGLTYSQLMREMAIAAVAACGKGTAPAAEPQE